MFMENLIWGSIDCWIIKKSITGYQCQPYKKKEKMFKSNIRERQKIR